MTPPTRPPGWDPDPLYVPEQPVSTPRHGFGWLVVAVVVVILAVFGVTLFLTAPRPASEGASRLDLPRLAGAPRGASLAPPAAAIGMQPAPSREPAAALPPAGNIGTALVAGTASHVGRQFGPRYLALPEHRWGQPGIRVRICGDGGCIVRTSTDAGPDLAMQRQGRVADLNAWDFEIVSGLPASAGLARVTVEYGIADIPLPATDTE